MSVQPLIRWGCVPGTPVREFKGPSLICQVLYVGEKYVFAVKSDASCGRKKWAKGGVKLSNAQGNGNGLWGSLHKFPLKDLIVRTSGIYKLQGDIRNLLLFKREGLFKSSYR
jgi:hypothetical protein